MSEKSYPREEREWGNGDHESYRTEVRNGPPQYKKYKLPIFQLSTMLFVIIAIIIIAVLLKP